MINKQQDWVESLQIFLSTTVFRSYRIDDLIKIPNGIRKIGTIGIGQTNVIATQLRYKTESDSNKLN